MMKSEVSDDPTGVTMRLYDGTPFFLLSSTSCRGVLRGGCWVSSGRHGLCWSPRLFCWDWFLMLFTAWWQRSPTLLLLSPLKWQQPLLVYWQSFCSSSKCLIFYPLSVYLHICSVQVIQTNYFWKHVVVWPTAHPISLVFSSFFPFWKKLERYLQCY